MMLHVETSQYMVERVRAMNFDFFNPMEFQLARRALLLLCALVVPVMAPAQPSHRPAIAGIAFARFYTTKVAGAEHFYGSTLGFNGQSRLSLAKMPSASIFIDLQSRR